MRIMLAGVFVLAVSLILGCSDDQENNQARSTASSSQSSASSSLKPYQGSCTLAPSEAADEVLNETQKQTWNAQGIDHYRYEYIYDYSMYTYDMLSMFQLPVRVLVIDDEVLETMNPETNQSSWYGYSLDELFTYTDGTLEYDDTYGFVRYYRDSEACRQIEVTAFEPIAEANVTTEQHLSAYNQKIRRMTEERSCTQDSECAAIAYGVKACGGPAEYLIYSTPHVDLTQLQPLVNEYNAYAEQYNAQLGAFSDCMVVPAPDPVCGDGGGCLDRTLYPSSASSSCPESAPIDTAQQSSHKALWESHAIEHYLIEFYANTSYLPNPIEGHFRNKVVDGVQVWSYNLDREAFSTDVMTLETLFTPTLGEASYDETYGYVSDYALLNECRGQEYNISIDSFTPVDESNITAREWMTSIEAHLYDLSNDVRCDEDAQCQSLPYGKDACGEPTAYLIYSTQHTDTQTLQPLINAYDAYSGQLADVPCNHVAKPETWCSVYGSCQAEGFPSSSAPSVNLP